MTLSIQGWKHISLKGNFQVHGHVVSDTTFESSLLSKIASSPQSHRGHREIIFDLFRFNRSK